jgi:hypothetical protein
MSHLQEACRVVRHALTFGTWRSQIPVLFTSGTESKRAILRKPFQLPALEKSIREALDRGVARDGASDGGDRVLQFLQWRGAVRRE